MSLFTKTYTVSASAAQRKATGNRLLDDHSNRVAASITALTAEFNNTFAQGHEDQKAALQMMDTEIGKAIERSLDTLRGEWKNVSSRHS